MLLMLKARAKSRDRAPEPAPKINLTHSNTCQANNIRLFQDLSDAAEPENAASDQLPLRRGGQQSDEWRYSCISSGGAPVGFIHILLQRRFQTRLANQLACFSVTPSLKAAKRHPASAAVGDQYGGIASSDMDTELNRRHFANIDAPKRRRCYSDDNEGMHIDDQLPSQNIRRTTQLGLPRVVRNDDHRIRVRHAIVLLRQHPPQSRLDPGRLSSFRLNFRRRRMIIPRSKDSHRLRWL